MQKTPFFIIEKMKKYRKWLLTADRGSLVLDPSVSLELPVPGKKVNIKVILKNVNFKKCQFCKKFNFLINPFHSTFDKFSCLFLKFQDHRKNRILFYIKNNQSNTLKYKKCIN